MIAVSGGDNEDLGNNGDDNCCSSLEDGGRGRGRGGLLLILNFFYHIQAGTRIPLLIGATRCLNNNFKYH